MSTETMRLVVDAETGAAVRDIKKVSGAIDDLDHSHARAEKSGHRLGTTMSVVTGIGITDAARAAFNFGKEAVSAFKDASASAAVAEASLDRNNKGWRAHKDEIEKTLKAHENLSGFDEHHLFASFANLARVSGSVKDGLTLQNTAMDVARARGMSLEGATNLVAKASIGNTKALKALAIQLPQTASVSDVARAKGISLAAATKLVTQADAQAAAGHTALQKSLQKQAAGIQAVDALNRNFAGSTEKYGKSAAGEADKIGAHWEDLKVEIGQHLMPVVAAVMNLLLGGVTIMKDHSTEVKIAAIALGVFAGAYLSVMTATKVASMATTVWTSITKAAAAAQWLLNVALNANPIMLTVTALAAFGAGLVIAYQKSATFRAIVQGALSGVVAAAQAVAGFFTNTLPAAFGAVIDWLKGNWKTIATVISGPFAPLVALATDAFGIRSAMTKAITETIDAIKGAGSRALGAGKQLASDALSGFRSVAWDIANLIRDRVIQPMISMVSAVMDRGRAFSSAVVGGLRSIAWDIAGLVNDRIITPLRNAVGDIITRGRAFGSNLIDAMGSAASAAWNGLVAAFKGVLNKVIDVLNKIPFVNIPKLAQGGVIQGPQLAVVGEDGPEVVVPVGSKRRARGQELLTTAAKMLGLEGDGPGPAKFAGIPMLADGAVIHSQAGVPASNFAAYQIGMLKAKATTGWGERLMQFARDQLGNLVGMLPVPNLGNTILNQAANYVKSQAVAVIKGVQSAKDQWALGDVLSAQSWAQGVMGRPYVFGGGHGSWNFNLPGYDCSGFSSHAAKKAGAPLAAPGTTMSLFPGAPAATGMEPILWGFRHMNNPDPSKQHMGTKILGTWYQFGDPGHTGGGDSQWDFLRRIPGYQFGVDYVPRTGLANLHVGEMVLDRQRAAAVRAGAAPVVNVIVSDAMGWLREHIRVTVDQMTERARHSSLAAGAVR